MQEEGEELVGREGDKVGKPLGSQQPFPDTLLFVSQHTEGIILRFSR